MASGKQACPHVVPRGQPFSTSLRISDRRPRGIHPGVCNVLRARCGQVSL